MQNTNWVLNLSQYNRESNKQIMFICKGKKDKDISYLIHYLEENGQE